MDGIQNLYYATKSKETQLYKTLSLDFKGKNILPSLIKMIFEKQPSPQASASRIKSLLKGL